MKLQKEKEKRKSVNTQLEISAKIIKLLEKQEHSAKDVISPHDDTDDD